VHVDQFLSVLLRGPDVHVVAFPLQYAKVSVMLDGGRQGDPREYLLAPGIAQVFLELLKDKQGCAILKLLHY
jgi:hypothetical protein